MRGIHRRTVVAIMLAVVAGSTTACATAQQEDRPLSSPTSARDAAFPPEFDPTGFVTQVDNLYFPLSPGTVFVLEGKTDAGLEHEEIVVTDETRDILGVTTVVVHDRITIEGRLAEDTLDWYAQDTQGNVWYFGEATESYERGGSVSTEGSWEAGVDGAQPGIIMPADPRVPDGFRQEFYEGHAQDMAWVVETGRTTETPYRRYSDVVVTLEWTPLEPDVVVRKSYAPGIGIVREDGLAGGLEHFKLLDIRYP